MTVTPNRHSDETPFAELGNGHVSGQEATSSRSSSRSSRADLHIHSKHSDRPAEWFLRRIGAPECYVEPLELYQQVRRRGMDFVTITDHNSISGALEIAHLPYTFISSEVTTYFPEDGCKIHCLVFGIDEEQFRTIEELRPSVYELQRYLVHEDIVHSVSHPLFSVNDRLTVAHVEKLLLLFNRFEAINGARHAAAASLVMTIFGHLTPQLLEDMANRHDIEPVGPEPWAKCFTAGSDDHSGLYGAAAHTVTSSAATVEEFLDHLRHGRHEAAGSPGGSLLLGHSLYQIAYSYYKSRFLEEGSGTGSISILSSLMERLLEDPEQRNPGGLERYLPGFAASYIKSLRMRSFTPMERALVDEFTGLLREKDTPASVELPSHDRHIFQTVSHMAHMLGYRSLAKCKQYLGEGRLIDSLQTMASLVPVGLGIAPYLTAFATQHKDDAFLTKVAEHFPMSRPSARRPRAKAWVTDTFVDVNGVTRTIQALGMAAKKSGRRMTVLTCLPQKPAVGIDLYNFTPVGMYPLPEYEIQELAFPPFMEVMEYLEREEFDEVIISTPGPLGLAALAGARLMGIRVTGIYHSDFPLMVRRITADPFMEQLTWRYMQWFYSQMDTVAATSQHYSDHLVDNGFDPRKLWIMGHGVNLDQFNPGKRQPDYWKCHGLTGNFTFIYLGRVSPDKDVELLLRAFVKLAERRPDVSLAVVGDGPSLGELREAYRHPQIVFTGFLRGQELSVALASADALVFPSKTDTFGNVVLESLVSGLPAIVSNCGGPPEIVRRYQSGIIVDITGPDVLADAMQTLAQTPGLCAMYREHALLNAQDLSWEHVLRGVWEHPVPVATAQAASYRRATPEPMDEVFSMDVA